MSPLVLIGLIYFPAKYGRYRSSSTPSYGISKRLGWIIMESPSVIMFSLFYFSGENYLNPVSIVLFTLFQIHYVHRAFIFPFHLRSSQASKDPIYIPLMGALFNTMNSYLIASFLSSVDAGYKISWLTDSRFLIGITIFAVGYYFNRDSDYHLISLRKQSASTYMIPTKGLYRYISCPNYFGEMLIWLGFALATWHWSAFGFFVFTVSNLGPRAFTHHKWYLKNFKDYPIHRKALIPGLI